MKHILLPEAKEGLKYYKANLHCHTAISDGKIPPEEVKERYRANGYSIIAFTDHCVFLRHNELTDENFLALNGVEFDINDPSEPEKMLRRTCHICMIALDPDTTRPVCVNREKYVWGKAKDHFEEMDFPADLPDYERSYSHEGISDIMQKGREGGFFVTYNHPDWSLESFPEYSGYHGMHAMEIVNGTSVKLGYRGENARCYDELLNLGNRIFCTATDDNHNGKPAEEFDSGCFGGYTMIAAEKLDYRSVTQALLDGKFYCGSGDPQRQGPEILSLEYEDGVVRIRAKGAHSIALQTGIRVAMKQVAEWGQEVTEAEFELPDLVPWFRLTLQNEQGFRAYTNAYFTDELK